VLTEVVDIAGIPMTVVDTAGIRATAADAVEAEGIARAHAARDVAALVILVLDRSRPLTGDDRALLDAATGASRVVVANKSDLAAAWDLAALDGIPALTVSAQTGDGVDRLRNALAEAIGAANVLRDTPAVTNVRHAALLERAHDALARASAAAADGAPEELVVMDVGEARGLLEEVTGRRTPDDILKRIFDTFCIGK
jgi:tRNA modification GTPase